MKKYTILEALKEIERLFPHFRFENLIEIKYENYLDNEYKFILDFIGRLLLVDLDSETYQLVE